MKTLRWIVCGKLRIVLPLQWLAASCSGGGDAATVDADPSRPDAAAIDADRLAPDATLGTPDAAAALSLCLPTCSTVADCDFGSPVSDPDNYQCQNNVCEYRGCNSTQECIDTYMTDVYACGTVPPLVVPTCLQRCTAPLNCGTPSPAYDSDNYRCTGGLCEYTGCNSTPECVAAFGANYGCHRFAGWTWSYCTPRCSVPAECSIVGGGPLYDADNYLCDTGYCRWTGCHSSAECQGSLMSQNYVCR